MQSLPYIRKILTLAVVIGIGTAAAHAAELTGTVRDVTGAAIEGAEVRVEGVAPIRTAADGRFSVTVPHAPAKVTVRAAGFRPMEQEWSGGAPLEFTLAPSGPAETVNVTASRTQLAAHETATSVTMLTQEKLAATAAVTLDDTLRQVPGFTLFRRSGSRTANPTAQGVSLRGIGASGASRALVLHDGVPLNDPFGGWVYWGRVPRTAIESVEVLRGGASSLYGSDALGGAINILPTREPSSALTVESSMGSQNTPNGSATGSLRIGDWVMTAAGEIFHTDGYILVDEAERGSADRAAGSEWRSGNLQVDRYFGGGRVFVRGGLFRDERENGTPQQINNTRLGQIVSGADWSSGAVGNFSVRLFGTGQHYYQTFTAVADDRNSERLTRTQVVPSQQVGASGQWSRVFSAHTLVAGADFRETRGRSDEIIYNVVVAPFTNSVAGGRQRSMGVFVEDVIRLGSRVLVTAGGRVDRWSNYNAVARSIPINRPGTTTVTEFPDRGETAFSPRGSLLLRVTKRLSLTASGYRSFRAPTLNELYRSFRVGDILTQANENLRSEKLNGAEGGATWDTNRFRLRGVFYWAQVMDPVANATLSVTPALITRQRQNLGQTRTRGVELDGELRLGRSLAFSAGYQFADARVEDFPANRTLEGLRVPQIPRHQLTFQARYSDPLRWTVAMQARAIGEQFEDDLNRMALDKFFVADVFVARHLGRNVELFAGVENLFDRRYMVGRTPVTTLGPPILARGGLRLKFVSR